MITSLSSSALNLMSNAHHKASGAAKTIATSTNDLHNPIVNLKEAEIESSAAVKLITTEKEIVGSLFDAIA